MTQVVGTTGTSSATFHVRAEKSFSGLGRPYGAMGSEIYVSYSTS